MVEIWMKFHLVSDVYCNIVDLYCPIFIYKEWQITLGLHLVLVTQHMQITISIEQVN